MKKSAIGAMALLALAAGAAWAQSFTPQAGYSATPLFSVPTTLPFGGVAGMGADSAGNLYYLERNRFSGVPDTRLVKRTAASVYSDPTELFSYGNDVFGSFVVVDPTGTTAYFGESALNTIRTISTSGGSAALLATVAGNYALAVGAGTLYVGGANFNASFTSSNAFVSTINPGTGAVDQIIAIPGEFSGPLALDPSGNLLLGATTFGSTGGGIHEFSAATLAGAGGGTTLGLGDAVRVANNGSNQFLSNDAGNFLYQAISPFGSAASVSRFTLDGTTGNLLGGGGLVGSTGTGDFFSGLVFAGGALYVAVTDSGFNQTNVFRVVPEPGTAILLLCALPLAAGRRRHPEKP